MKATGTGAGPGGDAGSGRLSGQWLPELPSMENVLLSPPLLPCILVSPGSAQVWVLVIFPLLCLCVKHIANGVDTVGSPFPNHDPVTLGVEVCSELWKTLDGSGPLQLSCCGIN